MTELQDKKERLAKLQAALDDILLGNRVTKGDIDGVGNAEFQTVKIETLEKSIGKLEREIAILEGRKSRMFGTPSIGGL